MYEGRSRAGRSLHSVMRSSRIGRELLFELGFTRRRQCRRHLDVMLQVIEQMLMMSEAEQRNASLPRQLNVHLVRSHCAKAVDPATVTLGGHQVALGQIASSGV